jgi:hypothetical protein
MFFLGQFAGFCVRAALFCVKLFLIVFLAILLLHTITGFVDLPQGVYALSFFGLIFLGGYLLRRLRPRLLLLVLRLRN